jgi:hypothetical protein
MLETFDSNAKPTGDKEVKPDMFTKILVAIDDSDSNDVTVSFVLALLRH